MGALSYLLITRTKNQFLQFIRSPGKVIYAAILVFAIVMSFESGEPEFCTNYRQVGELYVILWAVYTFVFITVSKNGFSNGSALFSMADVNLLFTSPIKNTDILIHAMLRQLGRSVFVGVILLMQFNTIHGYYGVSYSEFLLMVLFYGLTVFFSNMFSVMLYTLCSGNEKRVVFIKFIYYSVVAFFAVYGIIGSYHSGTFTVESTVLCLSKDLFLFFPVSGYFVMILKGISAVNLSFTAVGVAMLLLLVACFFVSVFVRKSEFYENVITSAEISSNPGGASSDDVSSGKKIKLGKIGFTKGSGAGAVYEKNKIENRRSGVLYIDLLTVVYALINSVCALAFDSVWMVFAAGIYLLMFSVSSGRWAKELKNPYIYLIPEKSSKKLFYMLKEQLLMHLVQSTVVVLLLYYILDLSVLQTLSMIFARFGFCLLFIGATLLIKNLFSTTDKGAFYGFVYLIICFVFSIPSITVAILMSMIFIFNFEIAFLSMFIVNTAVGALLVLCNRNLLDKGM